MSFRRIMMTIMALLLASVLPLQAGPAKGKPVKLLQQWRGSVDDLSLMKGVPKIIISAEELEKLWQAWKVPDPLPKVDFSKNLVVVATTRGSILRLAPTLDDKENLQVMGIATKDLRPGFRYGYRGPESGGGENRRWQGTRRQGRKIVSSGKLRRTGCRP